MFCISSIIRMSVSEAHLHYLCSRADADSMGRASFWHLVNKNSSLIAAYHCQLAEQRLALEGNAEHTSVDTNGFLTRTHQEGRGRCFWQASERGDLIITISFLYNEYKPVPRKIHLSKRRKRSRPLKSETRCESSTCLQFKDVYSCMRCSRCIRLSLLFSWITTSLEWKITVYIGWIAMKFCKNWHQLITKLVVIFLLVPSIVQDFNFVKKLKLTV